jgi:hypothetical protein
VNLWQTAVDATAMTHLACLPGLTRLTPLVLLPDAYAHLPRFPQLQRLLVSLKRLLPAQQAERNALLVSALSACPALTDLTLRHFDCSDSFGIQLMQAVPRLRTLRFHDCSLPALSCLRHAPHVVDLRFEHCKALRLSHVVAIGAFAPQLESLTFEFCDGLQLDEAEVQLLTPPGALGLPRLRGFHYRPFPEESDSAGERDEFDALSSDSVAISSRSRRGALWFPRRHRASICTSRLHLHVRQTFATAIF